MNRTLNAQLKHHPPAKEGPAGSCDDDPRWQLALQVVSGPHFARSPLLSKFLLFVVEETIEGRQAEITEHQIGVSVFGRSPDYRTDEDNIVRNYARQLRKRLAEHFATFESADGRRIDIPLGGYVPSFTTNAVGVGAGVASMGLPATSSTYFGQPSESSPGAEKPFLVTDRAPRRVLARLLLLGAYTAVLVGLTWITAAWFQRPRNQAQPADALWDVIFSKAGTTYVIPPDSGFNVLEDMAHASLPLATYIKSSYLELPAVPLDRHTDQDLRSQQYTDFVSLKIVATLARLPQFDPQRVLLRFPRDVRVDDLKNTNGIIIGSASANPWASIGDSIANFRIVPGQDMQGATIVNARPLAGEVARYESHWNEPSHETYALILFIPNLSGSGHMLLIEGLDVAGTEAAAEMLFHPDLLAPVLDKAKREDGGLRSFEVLLRSTSIQSNAAGTRIIASRIH